MAADDTLNPEIAYLEQQIMFREGPVAIRGDPDHPVFKGFICPRGRAAIEYYNHPQRIDYPLRRVGARGDGRWERISREEEALKARLNARLGLSGSARPKNDRAVAKSLALRAQDWA